MSNDLNKVKGKKFLSKMFALFSVTFIILVLAVSGPANAFSLGIEMNSNLIEKGEDIRMDLSVYVNSNEFAEINQLSLIIDGPVKRVCNFDVNGNIISGCQGVDSITRLDNTVLSYGYTSHGYGYGYTNGELKYRIVIDSSSYSDGIYTSILSAQSGTNFFESDEEWFKIRTIETRNLGSSTIVIENNEAEEYNPNNLNVEKGDIIPFQIKGEEHLLKVLGIDDDVHLNFSSQHEQNINVTLTEIKEVDLDLDSENDLNVSAIYIGNNSAVVRLGSDRTILFKPVIENEKINEVKVENKMEKIYDYTYYESKTENNNGFWILLTVFGILIFIEVIFILIFMGKR